MRRLVVTALLLVPLAGCISSRPWSDPIAPPVPIFYDNTTPISAQDPQFIWETVVDVVDDYFRIEREEPLRMAGTTVTEGRLETYPQVGSTCLEPWRHDSADSYEKLESTLQSIRRRGQVRVIPCPGGYQVEVAVFKELEDVARPAHASAGSATFRSDVSLVRVANPIGEQEINRGWIPLGRDRALEQRILGQVRERLGTTAAGPIAAPPAAAVPAVPPGQIALPAPPGQFVLPAPCVPPVPCPAPPPCVPPR